MATQWLRRGWLLAACASVLALAACGGGEVESELDPRRIVVFGDAFADVGQNGRQYTVNDGSVSNWTQYVANAFGNAMAPSAAGGLSYATGNARVTATPDAAGNPATPTVTGQIDGFFNAGNALAAEDLVIVNAGTSDLIVQAKGVIDGTQTREQALEAAAVAGRELGAQVRRLTQNGGQHVVVVGPYNLGRSAWAVELQIASLLEALSSRFNQQMLVSIVDLGQRVLYVDAALYFNLVTAAPTAYDLAGTVTSPVCTSVDPGPGIGTGAGQVNSNLCTTATLTSGLNHDIYLFADRVYPTPRGQRLFGEYAWNRIRERW